MTSVDGEVYQRNKVDNDTPISYDRVDISIPVGNVQGSKLRVSPAKRFVGCRPYLLKLAKRLCPTSNTCYREIFNVASDSGTTTKSAPYPSLCIDVKTKYYSTSNNDEDKDEDEDDEDDINDNDHDDEQEEKDGRDDDGRNFAKKLRTLLRSHGSKTKRKAGAKFGDLPGLGEARGSCQDLCPFSVISDDSSDIFGASHGISDTRYSLDTRRTTLEPVFRRLDQRSLESFLKDKRTVSEITTFNSGISLLYSVAYLPPLRFSRAIPFYAPIHKVPGASLSAPLTPTRRVADLGAQPCASAAFLRVHRPVACRDSHGNPAEEPRRGNKENLRKEWKKTKTAHVLPKMSVKFEDVDNCKANYHRFSNLTKLQQDPISTELANVQ
ncbi:hypothetical protein V1478_014349 [Vespula squamosa]|uniref:Uncharacterized protein n=1 Tax=Vespula squamosa TaxID=30214 RepID=A0ABD2A7R2_VESSQ